MNQKDRDILIDKNILLTQSKKDFLKKNFVTFPKSKQEGILQVLQRMSHISIKKEDIDVFSYSMNMWKSKARLQILESQDC